MSGSVIDIHRQSPQNVLPNFLCVPTMSQAPSLTQSALTCIASARLAPTEHLLLKDLIESAVDPNYISQHILQRIQDNPCRTKEETLRSLKGDWRRLTTRREASFYSSSSNHVFILALLQYPMSLKYQPT
jgi:hypothetical protein